MTEVDLATARSHVEQFKDISQASEAAFEKIHVAYEDYKKTAEVQLSQKEVGLDIDNRRRDLTFHSRNFKLFMSAFVPSGPNWQLQRRKLTRYNSNSKMSAMHSPPIRRLSKRLSSICLVRPLIHKQMTLNEQVS